MLKKRLPIIVVVAGLIVALCGVFLALDNLPRSLGTSTSDTTSVKTIFNQDLTGTWHTDDKIFSAKIGAGEIDLQIAKDGSSIVYWYGTFDSNPKQDGVIITSIPVPGKVYWSTETGKKFTYDNDHITFEFSALGTTKTVELQRG